jgi:cytochrome c peroxidase
MRLPIFAVLLASLAAFPAAAEDSLRDQAKTLFEPIPSAPPAIPGEAATPEKVALGKQLFFEPRISDHHDMSCSTCHNLSTTGVDARSPASSHAGQLGGRKTLSVINAVFNKSQYWDGRVPNLKEQVVNSVMANPAAMFKSRGGPIMFNPSDLTATRQRAVEELKGIPGYPDAFRKAFPDAADPVTYDNVGRAIAVFEATLLSPDSGFDRWLKGEDAALTDSQKEGLALFISKGCATCHNGVNLGGGSYAKFGVAQFPGEQYLPTDDLGRFAVTKNVADKYAFKVPSLRNVERLAPYFHSSATWDLRTAVAVMAEAQLGQKLTPAEQDKVTDFLRSLTGKQPEVVLPILPHSVGSTPGPQGP